MADMHIDSFEVSEYTQYFVEQASTLVGASPMVNVELVIARVVEARDNVEDALVGAGMQRSTLRTVRIDIKAASDRMVDNIRRFHRYVQSLPSSTPMDAVAFFPAGYSGAQRKAADLLAQGKQVLAGFEVPANIAFPGAPEWRASFTEARDALQQALSQRGSASRVSLNATSTLQQARLAFLAVYNGIAKRLVRVILQEVGREDEFPRFFLDLQVNEGGSRKPGAPETPALPGTPEKPALPGTPEATALPDAAPSPALAES